MNPSTLSTLFGIFLIAHGLVTMSLATVPVPAPGALRTPFFPAWWRRDIDQAWPVNRLGLNPGLVRTLGWVLWLAVLILFLAAGLGSFGLAGLNAIWQSLAAVGAVLSLVLLVLYWHPWLVVGAVLNIGILAGVYLGWFAK
jgi:hypothetical protein